MSVELVGLALLMGLVTYPSRALPLLAPGVERLPPAALEYLRLVGPAVLAALAAVSTMVVTADDGHARASTSASSGPPSWPVPPSTTWRRNLLIGLVAARRAGRRRPGPGDRRTPGLNVATAVSLAGRRPRSRSAGSDRSGALTSTRVAAGRIAPKTARLHRHHLGRTRPCR